MALGETTIHPLDTTIRLLAADRRRRAGCAGFRAPHRAQHVLHHTLPGAPGPKRGGGREAWQLGAGSL
jgi:hypothetical protein